MSLPLTSVGQRQAAATGNALKEVHFYVRIENGEKNKKPAEKALFQGVYSSDLNRTMETAAAIVRANNHFKGPYIKDWEA